MNKLLATLIFTLVTVQLEAQLPADVPKLVVGITVDQLRADYLLLMRDAFGDEGINKLLNEGTVYDDVEFEFPNLDRASALATIYTGTTPSYHGIIANNVFNTQLLRSESSLYDPKEMGNYTQLTLSPRNILTSTVSDELAVASDGLSTIISIAPTFEQAIIAGGHAANSVFWIDDENGKWATTTHYKDVPWYVEQVNQKEALSDRIEEMVWQPLYSIDSYKYLPYLSDDFAFKYIFSKYKEHKYKTLKTTPYANSEVTKLALEVLKKGDLGKKQFPDLLNIGYTTSTFEGGSVQQHPIETQDSYMRLDGEIATLLQAIDQQVGLENSVVFFTSTGYSTTEGKEAGLYRVPTGEFYPKRAAGLLNIYLMAIYGQQTWVKGFYDNQIYLDRELIESEQVDIEEIQRKAAEFVIQMAGVHDVTTSHQLLHGNWNNRLDGVRKGFHRKLSGDLLVEIQPGWEIVDENVSDSRDYVRMNAIPTALFFFGKNILPQHIARPIKATQIAPTVARLLRIRSPNAANEHPLPEIR